MRILIAEDDPTSRNMLALILRKWGHDVVETADGAAAWQALQQPDAPRVAILDWMMPEISGPDVVRKVRALTTEQPVFVIMLTTKGEKADIVEALDAGANDYLTKPFDPHELRARVSVGQRMVDLQAVLAAKIDELRYALEHIKTLRGIVPICANCKKIRDDTGYWNQVETFVRAHTEAVFSHSICPECLEVLYPDFDVNGSDGPTG
ncbi:MAG: response regulator transcription factor [Vicinamibacterales bacterium]|nr:response regulator transcription factor [Vicinamibacterales bacterium]